MSEKLVRSKMPELCRTVPGMTPMTYRYAAHAEMPELLRAKLLEEAQEVVEVAKEGHLGKLIEELADLNQVIKDFCIEHDIDEYDVEEVRKQKVKYKGSFCMGVVWDGNR